MNGTIVAGTLFTAASLGFGVVGYYLLTEELRSVSRADQYRPGRSSGEWISVEGKVTDTNAILTHTFVNAVHERYVKGGGSSSGSWRAKEQFVQSLELEVASGQGLIRVESSTACERGTHLKTVTLPRSGDEPERMRGLERGAPLTAIGALVPGSPPTLKAAILYADTRTGYVADLSSGFTSLYLFAGAMVLVGLAIVAKGVWWP
ncbi:MAG TPA: hypothetical protein VF815_07080 [Myxococcaceae bacterium]|jgi:hypothetical protein